MNKEDAIKQILECQDYDSCEKILDEYTKDSKLRYMADLANYKSRTEKLLISNYKQTKSDVLEGFLEVYDLWDHFKNSLTEDNPLLNDFNVLDIKMSKYLTDMGISEVEYDKFNPDIHHAVSLDDKGLEKDDILAVIKKGYRIGGELLRVPMVVVQK